MLTKDKIKSIALEIGFHTCGVTQVKPMPEAEMALREWTEQGKHGEMKYLERYDERKTNFWAQFPEAKSILVLGVNYYSGDQSKACHSERSEESRPEKFFTGFGHICAEDFFESSREVLAQQRPQSSSQNAGRLGNSPAKTFPVGRVARYAWGRDYHKLIAEKIKLLKEKLKQEASDEIYFESAVDTKPLLERTLGQQAGLGFIGKQTQLLSLQFGPWLFLSELITNLELEPDQPFNGSCGTCRLCIDECPTEAIEESGEIDARKCIAYLTIEHKTEIPEEYRTKIRNWVFGCDECLNVCPYTAKQKETTWKELTSENGFGPEMNLLELFQLKSNRQYENQFRDSAISRASRKQLLRNAAIVLGNTADKSVLPILEGAMAEAPLLVRSHIEWAIKEIKSRNQD